MRWPSWIWIRSCNLFWNQNYIHTPVQRVFVLQTSSRHSCEFLATSKVPMADNSSQTSQPPPISFPFSVTPADEPPALLPSSHFLLRNPSACSSSTIVSSLPRCPISVYLTGSEHRVIWNIPYAHLGKPHSTLFQHQRELILMKHCHLIPWRTLQPNFWHCS